MHRKLLLVLGLPAFCFTLIATFLYLGRDHLTRLTDYLPISNPLPQSSAPPTAIAITTTEWLPEQTSTSLTVATPESSVASLTSVSAPSATTSLGPSIANGKYLSITPAGQHF